MDYYKTCFIPIDKAMLETADYRLQPSPIPAVLTIQPQAPVTTNGHMDRQFQNPGLNTADTALKPGHPHESGMIREANGSSSSEEEDYMGCLINTARLNISDFSVPLSPTTSGITTMPTKSTVAPSTAAATCFSDLPGDTLFALAEHCGGQDLLRFCLASKDTMEASIPHIYRHVDLSTHNRGLVACPRSGSPGISGKDRPREETSDSVRCDNIPMHMSSRQEAFIMTLEPGGSTGSTSR